MVNGRLRKSELYLLQVRAYAMRSACINYKVGAIFVRGDRILAGGYNGPPRNEPNCNEVGCAKRDGNDGILPAGSGLCRGAHAEMNALVNASAEGADLEGTKVYCTFSPCFDCAKHLVNLGIREFVYEIEYKEPEGQRAIELLKRRNIAVKKLVLEEEVLIKFVNFNPVYKEAI